MLGSICYTAKENISTLRCPAFSFLHITFLVRWLFTEFPSAQGFILFGRCKARACPVILTAATFTEYGDKGSRS
ncbi:hypothetical protein K2173_026224 [Erythroxylum novogranatense]|uniref:Uncharacterized protein n=1 Tax=Erythroxylum novogranatense TaxID=1862640 RepID=A0AAV8SBM0_9ROSI|nr:hypothetical protein K2173_026224 [Erythroxylum novogranatense]